MIEPAVTVPLGFSLAAVVAPAEFLVALLIAEVCVVARSVDLQLMWIMGAQAVIVWIVVVERVEISLPIEIEVSSGVSRAVTSGNVSKNGIMLAAESHVASVMMVELVVSVQLAP